jgi:small subunit ribosomal protein S20
MQNRMVKTRIKTVTKQVAQARKAGDPEALASEFNRAKSVIDKAAKKGVIHPKTAARKKSRLARSINRATAA